MRPSRWHFSAILLISLSCHVIVPAFANGQHRVITACSSPCPLELTLITTLGDTAGSADGFLGTPQAISRTRQAEFLVADRYDQDRIKRFSASGDYLGHIGRRGKGPGEFEIVQFINILPGDSVETYDLNQQRLTVFSPNWTPVRTINIGTGAWEMVRLQDGSRVVAGYRYEPERIGLPLHHIDNQGRGCPVDC